MKSHFPVTANVLTNTSVRHCRLSGTDQTKVLKGRPGGSVHGERQTLQGSFSAGWLAGSRLYRSQILPVNTRWKSYLVGKVSPRSTQCSPLHRFGIKSFFNLKISPQNRQHFFANGYEFPYFHDLRRILHFFYEILMNFFRISRQIPEKSDACRFFNQICENKIAN